MTENNLHQILVFAIDQKLKLCCQPRCPNLMFYLSMGFITLYRIWKMYCMATWSSTLTKCLDVTASHKSKATESVDGYTCTRSVKPHLFSSPTTENRNAICCGSCDNRLFNLSKTWHFLVIMNLLNTIMACPHRNFVEMSMAFHKANLTLFITRWKLFMTYLCTWTW